MNGWIHGMPYHGCRLGTSSSVCSLDLLYIRVRCNEVATPDDECRAQLLQPPPPPPLPLTADLFARHALGTVSATSVLMWLGVVVPTAMACTL